ncbi:DUF7553 family protein [Natrononativus amylolyticus]|uniref:DUF7553 family protein n=1 Tax=Natrononativus amylolyticus TaxID=2963434 RepID=UPI0020CCEBA4|nr:hypothetical protein [Natrononativus amylolyticus]
MSKHFDDAQYYLKRASEHAKLGVKETLEPIEAKLRELTGREKEPEPGRVESLIEEVKDAERKAEGDAREALGNAREKLEEYRSKE